MFSPKSIIFAIAALSLGTAAAPAASCSNAYNGNSPTGLGPGTIYSCSKVSYTVTSYVCYVGSGSSYCCSGTPVSTSAGYMVGGCFAA